MASSHPAVIELELLENFIPEAETRFGFTAGTEVVKSRDGGTYSVFAIVEIEPGGALAHAGFRPGDIPVAHHGGFMEFCWALERAGRGFPETVGVVNGADWKVTEYEG